MFPDNLKGDLFNFILCCCKWYVTSFKIFCTFLFWIYNFSDNTELDDIFVSNKIVSVLKNRVCFQYKKSISLLYELKGLHNFTSLFLPVLIDQLLGRFFCKYNKSLCIVFVEQLSLIASSFMENHLNSCTKCFKI